jgi:hypothetical protein
MPSILTLQGPKLGGPIQFTKAAQLLGVTDTLKAHPWMVVGGLLLGGYLATKYVTPWGMLWGENRMVESRTRSLTGAKRKRRR